MILRIFLVFIISAIFISFMHEWMHIAKKIFSISVFRLCIPLLVLSWLMIYFQQINLLIFSYVRHKLSTGLQLLAAILPVHFDALPLLRIGWLWVLSITPIVYLFWRLQKRKILYQMIPSVYWLSLVLWVIFAFLLLPDSF